MPGWMSDWMSDPMPGSLSIPLDMDDCDDSHDGDGRDGRTPDVQRTSSNMESDVQSDSSGFFAREAPRGGATCYHL